MRNSKVSDKHFLKIKEQCAAIQSDARDVCYDSGFDCESLNYHLSNLAEVVRRLSVCVEGLAGLIEDEQIKSHLSNRNTKA